MPDDFDKILDEAQELTNKELDSRISSLIKLTDAEINAICPAKADKETLVKLISIVKGGTSENNKKKQLIENIETFAGMIVRVLARAV